MHKTKLTLALASLGVAGVMASHQASAQASPAIATANSGNSDLLFVAVDSKTGETYYNNLGVLALPTSNTIPTTLTFTDSSFTKFVSDAGSDQVNYAVIGGGNKTGAANPLLLNSYSTTAGGTTDPGAVTNQNLNSFSLIDQNIINPLNNGANVSGSGTTQTGSGFLVTQNNGPQYTDASGLTSWNGKANGVTDAAEGTANAFYNYTQNKANGTTGASTETLLGTFNFSGSTLTYAAAGTSAVPLPAAVWLLGSGLFGLFGIGRRRAAA